MSDHLLHISLAQGNFCVGDISGNQQKIIELAKQAESDQNADVVIFPELALTGYPPEDLLFRPGFHRRVAKALQDVASELSSLNIILGYPELHEGKLFNSAAHFFRGQRVVNYRKQFLPNYAVFDEKRYFHPGDSPTITEVNGFKLGLTICEDIWNPSTSAEAAKAGAEVLCNLNASPYHRGKSRLRREAVSTAAQAGKLPVLYVNTVGGQDELVFDGGSFCVDSDGLVTGQGIFFEESVIPVKVQRGPARISVESGLITPPDDDEALYSALLLGIRDYVSKNGFQGCVLGTSGGIDSALVLALAVDALGPDAVTGVSMPSRYTADMSIEDAREQARRHGCSFHVVPIRTAFEALQQSLSPALANVEQGVTAENLQARVRGVMLMAFSNASGAMVLATGNKSEMSVGYATLYGDMAGGFAPLKDVPKTMVYRLARWRNQQAPVIPERILERPPTAELAPGQQDSDSLPPYDVLDPILEQYIEADKTPQEIAEDGFDLSVVRRVAAMVDRNEYKRRQAAPGVRVSERAFGRDRRYPITSRYNEQEPTI